MKIKTFLLVCLLSSIYCFGQNDKGFIDAGKGVRIFFEKLGNGKEKIIVPMHFLMFEDFKSLAKEDRTIIFYDMRNRGRSSAVEDSTEISLQKDVDDLEKVRSYFGFPRVDLIGESYLGKMVVLYAMQYPQRVRNIVQIGAIPMIEGNQYPDSLTNRMDFSVIRGSQWNELQKLLREGFPVRDPKAFSKLWWNNFERRWLISDTTFLKNYSKASGSHLENSNEWYPNVQRHLRYHIKSFGSLNYTKDQFASLDCRVLTIHGKKDRNAPFGSGKEWAQTLKNSRLIIIPNGGHTPWIENPGLVLSSIDTFLKGEWPPSAKKIK